MASSTAPKAPTFPHVSIQLATPYLLRDSESNTFSRLSPLRPPLPKSPHSLAQWPFLPHLKHSSSAVGPLPCPLFLLPKGTVSALFQSLCGVRKNKKKWHQATPELAGLAPLLNFKSISRIRPRSNWKCRWENDCKLTCRLDDDPLSIEVVTIHLLDGFSGSARV